jgi:hypothetical protein
LIIPMIIQTIGLEPSRANGTAHMAVFKDRRVVRSLSVSLASATLWIWRCHPDDGASPADPGAPAAARLRPDTGFGTGAVTNRVTIAAQIGTTRRWSEPPGKEEAP